MAFEAAAALIGLREGMEIFLVLGILLGILSRLGHPERAKTVWIGFAAGLVTAALAGGLIVTTLYDLFEQRGGAEAFEVIVALAAVGVLTWMVLWMQRQSRHMVQDLKAKTEAAVESGSWFAIGFLAYVTVLREGLEVVLFYSALANNASWTDLILSGLVGFGISAVLAAAVFRTIVRVDVKRFFAVSGFLLVIIAAGLLVHVGHAAADLGWLPHGAPLWDTSGVLPDEDHWLGGPLHAFIGYEDQPTALQLLLYLGYILGVGGWYATRLVDGERRSRATTTVIAIAIVSLFLFSGASAAGLLPNSDGHGDDDLHTNAFTNADHKHLTNQGADALAQYDGTVGLLIRQHGEWIEYNASTYESVKAFVNGMWPYTGLPAEMLSVDDGTYLIDGNAPYSDTPGPDTELIDAWLGPYDLPALPVYDPLGLSDADESFADGAFHLAPGTGPGLGEGDLYELFGLSVYRTWLKMGNASPMYHDIQASWDYLATHIEKHYGDKVVVEFAFHVDPKMDPQETVHAVAKRLVDAGATTIVDAYQSSLHSDSMNTCMMAPHTRHALDDAGYEGPIVGLDAPAGTHPAWASGIADQVEALVADLPVDERISIHLAQHGVRPGAQSPCQDRPEPYNLQTQEEFALAYTAIKQRLPERDLTIRHVYGQGADAADDNVLAGWEAIDLDAADNIDQAIVVPYEFWGDGMDNLVKMRESYNVTTEGGGYYDENRTTTGRTDGVDWTIVSGALGMEAKATAYLARIDAAIVAAIEADGDGDSTT